MRCTSKRAFKFISILCSAAMMGAMLSGCGAASYELPYDAYSANSSFTPVSAGVAGRAEMYAKNLCVVEGNQNTGAVDLSEDVSAALFSLSDDNTIFAKNVFERKNPASLTKVMTALIALKNGNRDDVLTASENVIITESGAQLCGLKPGDTMTLDQALRILLMYSANDVAIMIAEHYGGTVEGFCGMMNAEAERIGATGSHFSNPNGLTDEQLYVTPYDMYLIFSEACKYELFKEIIGMSSYTTVYHDAAGGEVSFDKESTNRYVKGEAETPSGLNVIGGKTGTTSAAGHCLILLSSDTGGKSYISIVMQSPETDTLYSEMTSVLSLSTK